MLTQLNLDRDWTLLPFSESRKGCSRACSKPCSNHLLGTGIKTRIKTMHVLHGHVYSLSLAMSPYPLSRASACLAWLLCGRQGLEGGNCAEGPSGGFVSCFELGLPVGVSFDRQGLGGLGRPLADKQTNKQRSFLSACSFACPLRGVRVLPMEDGSRVSERTLEGY